MITTVGEEVGDAGEMELVLADEALGEADPQPATRNARAMADTAPRRPP